MDPAVSISHSDQVFLLQYLIGNLCGAFFGSLALSQALGFLYRSGEDRALFRWLVFLVAILTLVQVVCIFADTAWTFALGFGDLTRASDCSAFYGVCLMVTGLVGGVVQAFYAWRAWQLLSKKHWLLIALALLVLWSTGSWLFVGAALIGLQDAQAEEKYGWMEGSGYVSATATDAVLMALMLYRLKTASKTANLSQGSGQILWRLVRLSITTFTLTSVVNLSGLIAYMLNSGGDLVLDPILPHCYTLTLLFWLNAREGSNKTLQRHANKIVLPTALINRSSMHRGATSSHRGSTRPVSVLVTTDRIVVSDGPELENSSRNREPLTSEEIKKSPLDIQFQKYPANEL